MTSEEPIIIKHVYKQLCEKEEFSSTFCGAYVTKEFCAKHINIKDIYHVTFFNIFPLSSICTNCMMKVCEYFLKMSYDRNYILLNDLKEKI